MKIKDKVTKARLKKYFEVTGKAFIKAQKKVSKKHADEAKEILHMAECYYNDAKFFEEKGEYVLAYGALNYAHGWLDTGARLGFFNVKDSKLFTIK